MTIQYAIYSENAAVYEDSIKVANMITMDIGKAVHFSNHFRTGFKVSVDRSIVDISHPEVPYVIQLTLEEYGAMMVKHVDVAFSQLNLAIVWNPHPMLITSAELRELKDRNQVLDDDNIYNLRDVPEGSLFIHNGTSYIKTSKQLSTSTDSCTYFVIQDTSYGALVAESIYESFDTPIRVAVRGPHPFYVKWPEIENFFFTFYRLREQSKFPNVWRGQIRSFEQLGHVLNIKLWNEKITTVTVLPFSHVEPAVNLLWNEAFLTEYFSTYRFLTLHLNNLCYFKEDMFTSTYGNERCSIELSANSKFAKQKKLKMHRTVLSISDVTTRLKASFGSTTSGICVDDEGVEVFRELLS